MNYSNFLNASYSHPDILTTFTPAPPPQEEWRLCFRATRCISTISKLTFPGVRGRVYVIMVGVYL